MTHQVPEYYCSVSEKLSNILDNVGYSRGDRDRYVKGATEAEVCCIIIEDIGKMPRVYVLGSRGEGSTGPELQSDLDLLHQLNECTECTVITDLSQYQPELHNLLIVKDNHTHPGYVKLQPIITTMHLTISIPTYPDLHLDDIVDIDSENRFVVPNTVINNYYGVITGPSLHVHSAIKELSVDNVYALRCSQWPQEGHEWFQRRRFYGWPTPIQIENAREYGCFITPVGHVHSSERHLEWRLSFSLAERNLTRSFEDTVMKVYILMKMIRKTYIEPVVGDAFSSYHCKVCMLWMRETIPLELWNNRNILSCLIMCIKKLYEWASTGFCPDYFIVTNNIYDRKIIGAVRFNLVQILKKLLFSDCTFLFGIKCCSLGQRLTNESSRFDHNVLSIAREDFLHDILVVKMACAFRSYILQHIPQHYPTLVDYLDRIYNACKHLPSIMQYPLKYLLMVLWSQLGFHIATICREKASDLFQEQLDYLMTLASACISLGINTDATSVRLKLCGLGMELGNYELTETCLLNISKYPMRYIHPVDQGDPMIILKLDVLFNKVRKDRKIFDTEELLQTQLAFSVVYLPCEISITPKPLRMEMFRSIEAPSELRNKVVHSWFDWGVIDSLFSVFFFQYLTFSRQGKERHKQVAMHNMIHVIRTEPNITHRDTTFNLLGYSLMQENQLSNAFRCFAQSLKIRTYHNAAKFYLGILLKRVQAMDRSHTRYGSKGNDVSS